MLIVTKNSVSLVRKHFKSTSVKNIPTISDLLLVDPSTGDDIRECFIIATKDLLNAKVRNAFLQALDKKDPRNIVLYIESRKNSSDILNHKGINKTLIMPSSADIVAAIEELLEARASGVTLGIEQDIREAMGVTDESEKIQSTVEVHQESETVPELNIPTFEAPVSQETQVSMETINVNQSEYIGQQKRDELKERIKNTSRVADVAVIAKELSANEVVKNLLQTVDSYAVTEQELRIVQDKISNTLIDNSISYNDKMTRVEALLHDKSLLKASGNTMLVKRLSDIIQDIIKVSKELYPAALRPLDRVIAKATAESSIEDSSYAALRGIAEERSNALLELTTLKQEINDIYMNLSKTMSDTAKNMAEDATNPTHIPLVDDKMKVYGSYVVQEETLNAIGTILGTLTDNVDSEFKVMLETVSRYISKLNTVYALDKEAIEAQNRIISFIKSNNVEDTVVADTLLKKAIRLYFTTQGTGASIIPYLISKEQTAKGINTLLIDITGTCKLENYGVKYELLKNFMEQPVATDFAAIAGMIAPGNVQEFIDFLTNMASNYRIINVVVDIGNIAVINELSDSYLTQTFIVEPEPTSLKKMARTIELTTEDKIPQKVIVNKCSVPIQSVVNRLGLGSKMNFGLQEIPYMPQIANAAMEGFDPFGLTEVRAVIRRMIE